MRSFHLGHLGVAAMLSAAAVSVFGISAHVNAAPGDVSSVVPIVPCRLFDTRATETVGTRSTPINAGEEATFAVWGTNGNCTIPNTTTGIIANVTVANPTSASFLTVYPSDAPLPFTSNLNWTAGVAPTPNLISVAISASGAIKVFNNAGTVDVILDIMNYFVPAVGGARRTRWASRTGWAPRVTPARKALPDPRAPRVTPARRPSGPRAPRVTRRRASRAEGAKGDTGAQGPPGQSLVHYALTPPHPHFHDANVREVKGVAATSGGPTPTTGTALLDPITAARRASTSSARRRSSSTSPRTRRRRPTA